MRLDWQPDDMPAAGPFWESAASGKLVLPWCGACARPVTYPRDFCPRCHATVTEQRELSGHGVVYSYAVETRPQPGCDLPPPFVVALVDLAEGGRLVTNVLADPRQVSIGLAVEAVFVTDEDGRTIPRFVPRTTAGNPESRSSP